MKKTIQPNSVQVFNLIIHSTYFTVHTTYTRNNMGQNCEGNCGLWVLNEIIKKILGAVWELKVG